MFHLQVQFLQPVDPQTDPSSVDSAVFTTVVQQEDTKDVMSNVEGVGGSGSITAFRLEGDRLVQLDTVQVIRSQFYFSDEAMINTVNLSLAGSIRERASIQASPLRSRRSSPAANSENSNQV